MPIDVGARERLFYGRPLDPTRDRTDIRLVPRSATALIGRSLLAAIFVLSGLAKLTDLPGTILHMREAGIPAAGVLVWIAGVAEVAGGLSLISGFLARIGALGLLVYLALTTWFFHAFWELEGPERLTQMVQFMKNLAIAGGLLLLFANGPGRYSLDYRRRRPLTP